MHITLEKCKISELPPNSHGAIINTSMMFKCKITEVKICVLLHENLDVTFAENDAAAYTSGFFPVRWEWGWVPCYWEYSVVYGTIWEKLKRVRTR